MKHASDLLIAPPVTPSTSAVRTSPYRKAEDQRMSSGVLDPASSMENLDLWRKAYDQLSRDAKMKTLVERYEVVLEDSHLDNVAGNTFASQVDLAL